MGVKTVILKSTLLGVLGGFGWFWVIGSGRRVGGRRVIVAGG
jgi:hypothetical protein